MNGGDEGVAYYLFFAAPMVISGVWLRQMLKFRFYLFDCTNEEFAKAIDQTKTELNWHIESLSKNQVQASCKTLDQLFSPGELITIIKEDNGLYINCVPNPDLENPYRHTYATFGMRKVHVKRFIENIDRIIKNLPPSPSPNDIIEPQWTLKNTLLRVVLYLISIGLLSIAVFLLIPNESYLYSLILFLVVGYYLYYDIQLIRGKKK